MLRDSFPPKHPINRTGRIADLVLADARAAISCHACFVAVNDEVRGAIQAGWSKGIANADILDVTTHSLVSYLALRLARLFDPGRPGATLDSTDLASIPILMRHLADEEVARHLVEEARRWTPGMPGMAEIHAKGVEDALRESSALWSAFAESPEGTHALAVLKLFRNHALAHTLDKAFGDALPTVSDLFRLVDCLVTLSRPLSLALRGEDWEPEKRRRRGIERGREFWRRSIEANRAV